MWDRLLFSSIVSALIFLAFAAVNTSVRLEAAKRVKENAERIQKINERYAGSCVNFPPYKAAKVISYFEINSRRPKEQLQLVVQRKNGDEDALFVDAEPFLALDPQPCNS